MWKEVIKMNILKNWTVFAIVLVAALTSCTQQQQNQRDVRERTAEATAEARNDANAVVEGIREGWDRSNPLDLNTAKRDQLMSLPGMSAADADKVIAGRPYNEVGDLMSRHILSKSEYERIRTQVTAK